MGSWSVYCGISKIAITEGQECCIIPLKKVRFEFNEYLPAFLPIFGQYDDYGGMEHIVRDKNVDLIESHLGISIEEFVEFLVDGKFTYDRPEVIPIRKKLKKNGMLSLVSGLRFMWVDRKVYDLMSSNVNDVDTGHHNLGTPEMLNSLGFELVSNADISNYDPARFNKKYQKDGVFVYSDGNCMLSEDNQYIHSVGENDNAYNSLSKYISIPDGLKFIDTKTPVEIWRLLSHKNRLNCLLPIFGYRYIDVCPMIREVLDELDEKAPELDVCLKYITELEIFGDAIVGLINCRNNMYSMSSRFTPHVLYLTPQFGDYETHQMLLDRFSEINRSYLSVEENTE